MAQKKHRKIASLLDVYSRRDEQITVLVKGSITGLVLYEGRLWDVPYGLCTDYVMAYKYAAGLLEIVCACNPFVVTDR